MRYIWYLFCGLIILGLSACNGKLGEHSSTSAPKLQTTSATPVVFSPVSNKPSVTVSPTTSPPVVLPSETQPPTQYPTETIQLTSTSDAPKLVPDELRKYIGIYSPPLPENLVKSFGMMIIPSNIGDYSLRGIHKDDLHMLWLGKKATWESEGEEHKGWETLDILVLLPLEGENERLIPGGCMIGSKLDPEIIVVALFDDEVHSTRYVTNEKILLAWRANRSDGAFQEISTDGIECYADDAMSWK